MDGRKLRVSEYKQLMKARRQDVRHLWYSGTAVPTTVAGGSGSGGSTQISGAPPAIKPTLDEPHRRAASFFDSPRSGTNCRFRTSDRNI